MKLHFSEQILQRIGFGVMWSALYAVLFLIPIITLPWTLDTLEIHKQFILVIGASIAVLGWLITTIAKKQIDFQFHPILAFYGIFVLALIVSASFSLNPYMSWVGHGLQEYTSVITHASFWVLGFVLVQDKKGNHIGRLSLTLLSASVCIGTVSVLKMLGIELIESWFIGKGTMLLVFLSAVSLYSFFLSVILLHESHAILSGWNKKVFHILSFILFIETILLLLSIDISWMWIAFILSVVIPMVLILFVPKWMKKTIHYAPIICSIVIALLFLVLPSFISNIFPAEHLPSYDLSFDIAQQSATGSRALIGTGPGTFAIDYMAHRPLDLNASRFWNTIFDRGYNYPSTLFATTGILGLGSFILFLAFTLFTLLREIQKNNRNPIHIALLSAMIFLYFGIWYGGMSLTILFLFVILVSFIASTSSSKKAFDLEKSSIAFFVLSKQIVLSILAIMCIVLVGSKYTSDIAFAKTIRQSQENYDASQVLDSLDRAARFNKQSDVIYRNIAQALLVQINHLAGSQEIDEMILASYMNASVGAAERSVELVPKNPENWRLLAYVYTELAPILDSLPLAKSALNEARLLYPTNAEYQTEYGRILLLQYDHALLATEGGDSTEQDALLQEAIEELQIALSLKSDYAPAQFYLAAAHERDQNLKAAIEELLTIKENNPFDIGVLLQIAQIYLRQGNTAEAVIELENAIYLEPNYTNAYWYLSFAREQRGEIQLAIDALQTILNFDAENPLVLQRLDALEQGFITEEIPEPLEETLELELGTEEVTE